MRALFSWGELIAGIAWVDRKKERKGSFFALLVD